MNIRLCPDKALGAVVCTEDSFAFSINAHTTRRLLCVAAVAFHRFYLGWRNVTAPLQVTSVAGIYCATAWEFELRTVLDVMPAEVRGIVRQNSCTWMTCHLRSGATLDTNSWSITTSHYWLNCLSFLFQRQTLILSHTLNKFSQVRMARMRGCGSAAARVVHLDLREVLDVVAGNYRNVGTEFKIRPSSRYDHVVVILNGKMFSLLNHFKLWKVSTAYLDVEWRNYKKNWTKEWARTRADSDSLRIGNVISSRHYALKFCRHDSEQWVAMRCPFGGNLRLSSFFSPGFPALCCISDFFQE